MMHSDRDTVTKQKLPWPKQLTSVSHIVAYGCIVIDLTAGGHLKQVKDGLPACRKADYCAAAN
jgi:hypothetical protein